MEHKFKYIVINSKGRTEIIETTLAELTMEVTATLGIDTPEKLEQLLNRMREIYMKWYNDNV